MQKNNIWCSGINCPLKDTCVLYLWAGIDDKYFNPIPYDPIFEYCAEYLPIDVKEDE
jgi:hypothetical protein